MSNDTRSMAPVILAYCDNNSARPGDKVSFMVSCENATEYRADIVRLGCCDAGQAEPPYRESVVECTVNKSYPARKQSIDAGSYLRIPDAEQLTTLSSFTMLVYIWPTRVGKSRQAIMGTWRDDLRLGYGLELDAQARLSLRIGDGELDSQLTLDTALVERRWQLVIASFDAATRTARLRCEAPPDHQFPVLRTNETAAVLEATPTDKYNEFHLAAWPTEDDKCHTCHFDGKLDSPRVLRGVIDEETLVGLTSGDVGACNADALVAAWDFSVDIDSHKITDTSGHDLHGHAHQLPTRAVTGFNWTGTQFDWRHARSEYGAIHFHSDDIYSAEWDTDFTLTVPATLGSGIYAARLRASDIEYYVPFFVRPAENAEHAKVLFLVPSATYMAYANIKVRIDSPYTDALTGKLTVVDPLDLVMLERPELGLSTYDAHADGSPVFYSSRLRPVVNCRPKDSELTMAYNNLACDLLLIDWLDHLGIDYAVMTDEDLHSEGMASLSSYRVVVTGCHPEYYSLQMLDALDGFVRDGGRLMYMGGNGFYWRVAFHPDMPGVIEHRRAQQNLVRWNPGPGQSFHSFSGEHGGIWWDLGRAPQLLTGVGFIAQGFDVGAPYYRKAAANDSRAAFMFDGVDEEVIGETGLMPGGNAGIEVDRYSPRRGSPTHALVVASSRGHSRLYETLDEVPPDGIDLESEDEAVRADMLYFETANGGAVFSVGSIAYAFGLAHNGYRNSVARIAENVLRSFSS